MTEELEPCPFCGEAPYYEELQDEDIATHNIVTWKSISCPEDCAQVSIPDGYEGGSAIERWNARATPAPDRIRREALEMARAIARDIAANGTYNGDASVDTADAIYQGGAQEVVDALDPLIDTPAPTGDRVAEAARVLLDDPHAVDQLARCIRASGNSFVSSTDMGCALSDLASRAPGNGGE